MPLAPLRFQLHELTSSASGGSTLSDAFTRFVLEVLQTEYPGAYPFPERGKDGAIDFVHENAAGRTFGETKIVASDRVQDVLSRWAEVAKRLQRNLADPAGPPSAQSQYAPWYRTDLRKYVFCTSALLGNLENHERVQSQIRGTFQALGDAHPHLSHLAQIEIQLLDWGGLTSRAGAHSQFRWFRRARPQNLVPIEQKRDIGTFRAYLQGDRLPYYSLGAHLESHAAPVGSEIEDEDHLVSRLHAGDAIGSLIVGPGGVGKTRLTREIGLTAIRSDWLVMFRRTRLYDGRPR